mgnify:CR=1 FL=1
MAEEDEISDEAFGQLRLKRKAGGTGYSKELCLRNQPLETQCWFLPQFLRNWLAGSETLSF